MPIDNPEGTDDTSPLSLDEAAAAYASLGNADGPDDGQPDTEQEAQDDVELEADEAEQGDEPEDEGQAEDEPEEPAIPAYVADDAKVKLADGTEVTVAELKNGTLRLQDYRQKTAEIAEQRRAFEAKSSEFQQLEQQVSADRDFMVQLMQSLMPQKPDYSMVSVDPIGYAEQNAQYQARKEQLDYLVAMQQHTAQKRQADEAEASKEVRAREWQATLDHMPELKDPQRLSSFVGEIQKAGAEYGYTPAEIQNVGLDHRQVLVLRDAIKWRNLQASKSKVPAKVEGRPPVQRAGTRQSPEAQKSRDARVAMDRLKSSGSLRDGVAALLAIEKG